MPLLAAAITVLDACHYLFIMQLKQLLVFCGLMVASTDSSMTCRDESGNEVDWFILLKHPIDSGSSNPLIKAGLAYVTITSKSASSGWELSSRSIADADSYVGRTLQQFYDQYQDSGSTYILYNDEKPDGSTSSAKGHAKGVASFTDTQGFWLIHSVPKFPPVGRDGYSFPSNGDDNGQSFICISLTTDDANAVGGQLRYSDPYIYDSKVASWTSSQAPDLEAAIAGEITTGSRRITLTSKGGQSFASFAKYRDFGKDLYAGLVAPSLGAPLLVQTWRNGAGAMPSSCTGTYEVENVEQINVAAFGSSYPTTKDHSKWAVSKNSGNKWACVGDINRMDGQLDRGGGTLCIGIAKTWEAFYDSVATFDACSFKHD